MNVERYGIISLEAMEIYKQIQKNGSEKGFILPKEKNKDFFDLFKNILDYSLDLIELKKWFKKKYRKEFSFEDEYKNKYTLAVINLKFSLKFKDKRKELNLKELRKYFYENGFNLGGIHYIRYKRSSGSSREGKCLFIDEKLYNHMSKWGECGLKVESNNSDLAAWESYKSLSLSSLKGTIRIPLESILFIDDYESKFFDEAISVEERDGKLIAEEKTTLIENKIWDGESLLDESLFTGNYEKKHMLLLRNKFFKSCGFKTKLQKWFEDKNISLEKLKSRGFITFAKDIKEIFMVTTRSSMKFLKFMGNNFNEDNIRKWIDKVDENFGVVKFDKRTKFFDGKMVQSSYQLINTLGFNKSQSDVFVEQSLKYLDKIRDDYDFMRYHFEKAYKKEFENEKGVFSDGLQERADVIFKLMKINYKFKNTKLYYNFRNKVVHSQKNKLKEGHILVQGTNATLFGNGPEMLMALSGEFDLNNPNNEPMILKEGEILCRKFSNDEKLVCARSPHITMGNIYCTTNKSTNEIWDYFDLGENIVCVNAIKENVQQRLNGCDYDSDAMLITNDKLIVEIAFSQEKKFKVPVFPKPKSKSKLELFELDYETSENKIGEIVNMSQKLNSIIWDKFNKGESYKYIQKIYKDVCKLAVLSGIEIDKAKNDYSKINVSQELKLLSENYRLYKRPDFFKIFDDKDIEKRIRSIKEKAIRNKKRAELRAKKEYNQYQTAMSYILSGVNEKEYRKGKNKKNDYIAIIDMLNIPKKITSSSYRHRDTVIEICEHYSKVLNLLYEKLSEVDDDEKDLIYIRIKQAKDERKSKISLYLKDEYTIYLVLKEYEKIKAEDNEKTKENWHLYAPLLENEFFINILKESKEKMKNVYESVNGEYELYHLKFTKK